VLLLLLPEHVECDSWVVHNLLGGFFFFVVGEFFLAYETMMFLFVKSCSAKGGCIQGFGEHVLTVSHKDTKCFRTFLFLLFL
jgi:hypothetical protein